jgi:hypothetical protein
MKKLEKQVHALIDDSTMLFKWSVSWMKINFGLRIDVSPLSTFLPVSVIIFAILAQISSFKTILGTIESSCQYVEIHPNNIACDI